MYLFQLVGLSVSFISTVVFVKLLNICKNIWLYIVEINLQSRCLNCRLNYINRMVVTIQGFREYWYNLANYNITKNAIISISHLLWRWSWALITNKKGAVARKQNRCFQNTEISDFWPGYATKWSYWNFAFYLFFLLLTSWRTFVS